MSVKELWSKSKPAKDFPKNWLVVSVLDVKDLELELKKLRVKYNSALSCLPVLTDSEIEKRIREEEHGKSLKAITRLTNKYSETVRIAKERVREEERTKFEKSLAYADGIIKKTENKFKKIIKENINDLDQIKKDFVKNDNETVWVGETETLFDRLYFLQKKYGKSFLVSEFVNEELQLALSSTSNQLKATKNHERKSFEKCGKTHDLDTLDFSLTSRETKSLNEIEDYLLSACAIGIRIQQGKSTSESFMKWKEEVLFKLKRCMSNEL